MAINLEQIRLLWKIALSLIFKKVKMLNYTSHSFPFARCKFHWLNCSWLQTSYIRTYLQRQRPKVKFNQNWERGDGGHLSCYVFLQRGVWPESKIIYLELSLPWSQIVRVTYRVYIFDIKIKQSVSSGQTPLVSAQNIYL